MENEKLTWMVARRLCSAWGGAAKDVAQSNPHTATIVFCLFSAVRGVASIIMPFLSDELYTTSEAKQSSALQRTCLLSPCPLLRTS